MKFGFYRIGDPNKEIIMNKTAESMHHAVQFFAATKSLSIVDFLKIFAVVYINLK